MQSKNVFRDDWEPNCAKANGQEAPCRRPTKSRRQLILIVARARNRVLRLIKAHAPI